MNNSEEIKSIAFLPLADRVLVLPDEPITKTKSGIFIPDNAKEVPAKGTIIRMGTGLADKTFQTKVGDVVGYSKYAGSEITVERVEYKLLRETDLLGIYE